VYFVTTNNTTIFRPGFLSNTINAVQLDLIFGMKYHDYVPANFRYYMNKSEQIYIILGRTSSILVVQSVTTFYRSLRCITIRW